MMRKSNVVLFTALFVFLLGVSAYGQCHLATAHSDFEAGHEEQIVDCPRVYLSASTGVISQERSSRNLASIDSITTIDTYGQAHIFSPPFKYKLLSEAYAFRNRYLWIKALRF